MSKAQEIQAYRDKQTLKLIQGHKDIITKSWEVIENDVLSDEIEKAKEKKNSTESLYWDKIAKRRKGLNEVETSLEKIEKLEKTLSDYKADLIDPETAGQEDKTKSIMLHPSKRHAQK